MLITDLLTPERVRTGVRARSKKRLLEMVAASLSGEPQAADERSVYSSLCARERIGSTGLGHGVAIPHGRIAGVEEASGVMIRLADPIDFDAPDGQPVDLIFALLVPDHHEDEHLRLLGQLAETFSKPENRQRLREAEDNLGILELLESWQTQPVD